MQNVIQPLYLLPPVSYFSIVKEHGGNLSIEQYENFEKQSFRTRFQIFSSQGIQTLTVPILHHTKGAIKQVQISYDLDWQKQHWSSIETCYRKASFYEFYVDDIKRVYGKKHRFLFDFNLELLHWAFDALRWDKAQIAFTEQFSNEMLNTKSYPNNHFKPYYQVFQDRIPFQPNLSIMDLIFNKGSDAIKFL